MPRKVKKTDSEFGEGRGLIDPIRRADRAIGQNSGPLAVERSGEELLEIYATDPADPNSTPENSKLERP